MGNSRYNGDRIHALLWPEYGDETSFLEAKPENLIWNVQFLASTNYTKNSAAADTAMLKAPFDVRVNGAGCGFKESRLTDQRRWIEFYT